MAGRIEAQLTRRTLDERGGEEEAGEMVEERTASHATYRRELVRCGKERHKKCATKSGFYRLLDDERTLRG